MEQARALGVRLMLLPLPAPCGGDTWAKAVDDSLKVLCDALGVAAQVLWALVDVDLDPRT